MSLDINATSGESHCTISLLQKKIIGRIMEYLPNMKNLHLKVTRESLLTSVYGNQTPTTTMATKSKATTAGAPPTRRMGRYCRIPRLTEPPWRRKRRNQCPWAPWWRSKMPRRRRRTLVAAGGMRMGCQ